MSNCRSIPPEAWEHVRKALVFYFSRRHGIANAEDLAHETIAAVLKREDFHFSSNDDFLRICYAFAGNVSRSGWRQERKHAAQQVDAEPPPLGHCSVSVNPAEMAILLDQVIQSGESKLSPDDWELVLQSGDVDNGPDRPGPKRHGNTVRVRLFRARRKLAELTGWRKELRGISPKKTPTKKNSGGTA